MRAGHSPPAKLTLSVRKLFFVVRQHAQISPPASSIASRKRMSDHKPPMNNEAAVSCF